MNLTHIIIFALSYLIGSLPATYFIVKYFTGKDISREGSGNVGAMNSFEVTGKRYIGIISFFADFLKGLSAVLLASYIWGNNTEYLGAAVIGAVSGHIASIFLKLRGGRGLSTAVGAFMALNPFIVVIWLLMYLICYKFLYKNIHLSNTFASVISPILIFTAPDDGLRLFNMVPYVDFMDYRVICIIVCSLLVLSHVKPLIEYFKEKQRRG